MGRLSKRLADENLVMRYPGVLFVMVCFILTLVLIAIVVHLQQKQTDNITTNLRALAIERAQSNKAKLLLDRHKVHIEQEWAQGIDINTVSIAIYDRFQLASKKHMLQVDSFTQEVLEQTRKEANNLSYIFRPDDLQDLRATILRVKFSGVVQHTNKIITLLHDVLSATQWRPSEARQCSIERLNTNVGLHVLCVIDFYHWDVGV